MTSTLRASRWLAIVALGISTLGLAACGGGADEQPTVGDEQDVTAKNGRFETFVGEDGQHYFQLVAGNGEKVLRSEGYTTAQGAKKGIASVKTNGVHAEMYDLLAAKSGEFYFNLLAKNGEIIGTSEMYATEANADRGAETVQGIVAKVNREEAAATGGAKFEVFKGLDAKYYFHLRAGNGEIVLKSEAYTAKQSAKKGVASVRTNGSDATNFVVLEAKNGQFYFNVVAQNGEVVGTGETYSSRAACEKAVASISALLASEKVADPK